MSRNRIFYGWWVLLGIFTSYTALVGVHIYTLSLFYPELMREFGWSEAQVTQPAAISFLTGAAITAFISGLFDRFSVRVFMILGATAYVVGLFSFCSLHTLTQMTAIYVVFAVSQVCAGQVPTMLVVTRWFKRYRGIAIGVTLTATSFGAAVFPLVVRHSLAMGRWRDAMLILTIVSGVMMLLPLIFVVRSRPEDKGLEPDGDAAQPEIRDAPDPQALQAGPSLNAALRMPVFYVLAFATGSLWFCMNGIVQHQAIFMNGELGVSMDAVPIIVSAIFWFAIAGKLVFGYLSDRFDKILMMLIVVVILIIGLSILRMSSADHLSSLYGYAAVFGVGFSGTFAMIQLVIAEFFSGRSYGKILGVLTSVDVAAGGIGITAVAKMKEAYGSYLPVIEILIGLCCLVALAVVFLYRMRSRISLRVQPG
jgi:OFA family oxalate/formate antiporter-like MFS transporter